MPYFWDFRTILDVDPKNDRTCVGTTQKGSGCKNPINMADRDTAGRLLDQMDRFKSLKSSFDHLETLAALLLCKHKHNNHKSFAHLSQVDEVTSRWIKIVEEEYRIVRKQKEKEKALKAKQELLRVSESARQMKAELEEEKAVRVPPKLSRNEPSSHHEPFRTTTTGLYDPFVTATSSLKANNTLPKQSKIHLGEAAKATAFTNTASKSHTSVKVEEVEIGTYDSPPSRKADTGLPTPETTPQDSRSNLRHHINQEYTPTPTQMKQREDPTQTLTPPSSIKVTRKTTEFTFEYGPGLGIQDGSKTKLEGLKAATEQIWSFPGFNEAKEQANKSSSSSSSQKQLPPSPALEVEVPVARVPLGVKSTSTHNNMKTGKPKIGYEFGNQEDMPFKGFNFGSNIPRLAALEAPKKARTSPPAHFISLGEPSQDISTSERKYTQDQLETRIASMSLGNSKSDIVLMSQVTSKSRLNSMSEPIPEPQRMSDIRNAPVSDKTIDIHLDTDNDSTTDIEATTPSTIHEFPTNFNARSPPSSSLSPTTNIRHPSSSPPRQKPEFGTAIIIPPSIPYKTHLLSRLNTIPQTLSHSTQSPTIQSPSSYAADLQIWERITVMEKPLPHLPWEWEPMKGEARKGSVVRVGEGYVDGNEEERVGCLGSRRLARLRRRFWAKLRGGEK